MIIFYIFITLDTSVLLDLVTEYISISVLLDPLMMYPFWRIVLQNITCMAWWTVISDMKIISQRNVLLLFHCHIFIIVVFFIKYINIVPIIIYCNSGVTYLV